MQTSSQTSWTMPSQPILWRPTAALAGVNAAITLSWIIYRVHLAGLLTQAGFPAAFAPTLLLIESILAIVIEPWAGSTSDRMLQRLGQRFYIILIGGGLTALLFVLLPGITQLMQPNAAVNGWFIGVLIVWAIAISMFRSPALALLSNYAAPKQLPLAASLITLAGALAGAMTPLATPWLLSLGITTTFIAAAILLLASMGWLKTAHSGAVDASATEVIQPASPLRASTWLRIFGVGLTVTLAFRTVVELFPKILKAAGMQPPVFMGIIFISLAIGALIAGRWATRWSNLKVMTVGLGLTSACLILITLTQHPVAAVLVAVAFGLSFSLIFNGTLPFALNFSSLEHAGLGVGLFFSGAATANSLYSGVLLNLVTPITGVAVGIVALLVAGFCILGRSASLSQQHSAEN